MSGIGWVTRASVAPARVDPRFVRRRRSSSASAPLPSLEIPPAEPRGATDDRGRDDVLDVAERVVEVLPRLAGRVSGACEREAPDRRSEEREERVPDERGLEHAGRDGDERAHDGRQPAQEDGPVLPALEPALGAIELLRAQMEPATVPLEVRAPAVEADRPAHHRAERVADRPGERDREVRGPALVDRAPEERHLLVRERSRGERAAVDHDELARRRQHGVDEHEQEDRVEAVVPDDRRDGVGQLAEDRGDEHRGSLVQPGPRRSVAPWPRRCRRGPCTRRCTARMPCRSQRRTPCRPGRTPGRPRSCSRPRR